MLMEDGSFDTETYENGEPTEMKVVPQEGADIDDPCPTTMITQDGGRDQGITDPRSRHSSPSGTALNC